MKNPRLLRRMGRRLVRAVWRCQGQVARRLGSQGPLRGAAVGFTQYFGAALQVTPHLHILLPEGLWDAQAHFVALPPPSADEVAAVLRRLLQQLAKDFDGLCQAIVGGMTIVTPDPLIRAYPVMTLW